jgi:hypothetical protein
LEARVPCTRARKRPFMNWGDCSSVCVVCVCVCGMELSSIDSGGWEWSIQRRRHRLPVPHKHIHLSHSTQTAHEPGLLGIYTRSVHTHAHLALLPLRGA